MAVLTKLEKHCAVNIALQNRGHIGKLNNLKNLLDLGVIDVREMFALCVRVGLYAV